MCLKYGHHNIIFVASFGHPAIFVLQDGKSPDAPPPFLNPQQMNMLHYLQQNQNNLNPQQQTMLHQLRQQYFAQQQYLIQQQQQSQNQLPESMDTTADTSSPEKIKGL